MKMTKPEQTSAAPAQPEEEWGDTLRAILLAVVVAMGIRSFAFEPFNIPSGSMIPSLEVGDFLFVSKYSYGYSNLSAFWGLPLVKGRIFWQAPQRGDVAVFKLPRNPSTDYIKRIVGLPGDRVQLRDGRLMINGELVDREYQGPTSFTLRPGDNNRPGGVRLARAYLERLPGGKSHMIVEEGDAEGLDNTRELIVPSGHYFFMGDNRDNSQDSRVTNMVGFVPYENLVGRAEWIVFSLADGVQFWEFWRWPFSMRVDRFFKAIE